MNVLTMNLTMSIVVDLRELEAARRSRIPAAGSGGATGVHAMPIVVDLRELEELRRTRIPTTDLADELGNLIPTHAEATPPFDFRAGAPWVPGRRTRLH
jgi:hypothetical protein